MSNREGFLVVQARDALMSIGATKYEGVDRVPPYYIDDRSASAAAMDFYVFGECKDRETNLIPSFEVAHRLATELSRQGTRHEVILCSDGPDAPALAAFPDNAVETLGYDVVGLHGDYWSIVGDWSTSPWADEFRSKINEHGLFDQKTHADEYLRQYVDRNEPDSDAEFDVVFVTRVAA
jgi:hypothetical protein